MIVVFISDLHLEEEPGTGQIYEKQQEALEEILEGVEKAEPDLILMGGDNCGPDPPYKSSPAERNAHIWFRRALCEIAGVIEVQGNHDYPGDYDVFNKLKTKHPLVFVTEPSMVDMPTIMLASTLDCKVWCLPWIFASAAGDEDPQTYARAMAKALIEEAREQNTSASKTTHFILGHVAIAGALIREGQPKTPTKDVVHAPEELMPEHEGKLLFQAGFFGHYHHRQAVREYEGHPVGVYGGSVFIRKFGEDVDKGWTLFDTKKGKHGEFTFYTVDQPPKVIIDYDIENGIIVSTKPDLGLTSGTLDGVDFDELEVRLDITVPEEGMEPHRDKLKRICAAIGKTATSLDVKYKGLMKETSRKGAKAVASATSLDDKVRSYLVHRPGDRLEPEEIDATLKVFSEIRSEVDSRV